MGKPLKSTKLLFIILWFALCSSDIMAQDSYFKVNTLKFLDYNSKSVLKTVDIDGSWGISGDILRIDYGLMKLNSSVADLKILKSSPDGNRVKIMCDDKVSNQIIIGYIYSNPQNEKKPILELDISYKKEYLQFSYNGNMSFSKKTYFYKNLSSTSDYKLDVRATDIDEYSNSPKFFTISIYNKSGALITRMEDVEYRSYRNVLEFDAASYITNIHGDHEEGSDGDFVVADFNFDGLADFAVQSDVGGNQGAIYQFYIQRQNGSYYVDDYLTKKLRRFPRIDTKNKILTLKRYTKMAVEYETMYYRFTSKGWENYLLKVDEYNESKLIKSDFYKKDEATKEWKIYKTEYGN